MELTKHSGTFRLGVLLLTTIFYSFSYDKNKNDSLNYKNIEYLKSKILENLEENENTRNNSLIYLKEAKKNNDYSRIAEAYYFLYLSSNNEISKDYLDSLLNYSKINQISKYLSIAYQEKGKSLFNEGEFHKALENYLLALDHIDLTKRPNIYFIVSHNIAILKDLIGQKIEALEIYRENFNHFQENIITDSKVDNYLITLFALSHSFTENGMLDSASYFNNLGMKEALSFNKPRHQAKFCLGEGYNLFYKKDFTNSLDSLLKAIPLLKKSNDNLNLAIGYLYASKILSKQNSDNLHYLLIADSLISKEKRYYPQFIEVYDLLNKNYKQKGNSRKQLLYLEKLIAYDKELREKYKNLYPTITKNYDQPRLVREKQRIIDQLENSNKSWFILLIGVAILLLTSISITFHHYRRRAIYKKRFEKLVKEGTVKSPDTNFTPKPKINLPDNLVIDILARMEDFENRNGFLNRDISLTKLAKLMETNSSYLSKIINHKKGKNYSNYINDLRIEYVLNELLHNRLMRQYTIKAIAHEIGFKNTESFSNAFFKKVGIYPSFYIKELNKSVTS